MSGSPVNAVADTNVLIDYLAGVPAARRELQAYGRLAISIVTWMEVLAGAADADEEGRLRAFLDRFELLPLSRDVAARAVALRRERRLRVPDAAIWATARSRGALLITRNVRDFPERDPGIRVPYRV
jgi:predicted nucleic acid-binding protein